MIMYTLRLEPKGNKTKKLTFEKKSLHRVSNSWPSIDNRSGLPLKLLMYDYYWDKIVPYTYTYNYALDFLQQQKKQKTRFCRGCHDTKRERPRPPPAESGGASKVRHVQETGRGEVDLSSSYLEDG